MCVHKTRLMLRKGIVNLGRGVTCIRRPTDGLKCSVIFGIETINGLPIHEEWKIGAIKKDVGLSFI
ncbi:hypothetical protein OUZ56_000742 [Daphnia magna]|uniref:Uncharacterized protein n=1 Tax=Daphnia magna TaxID=35525 RepID=A0ABR0A0L7_9CRUS|nr:hypothetical protein OUZ56_000742 [Daphnia magna]